MSDPLTDSLAAAAERVPEELLRAGADAIADADRWSVSAESALLNAIPAVHYREYAGAIARAWSSVPRLGGAGLAAAMRAASAAASAARSEQVVSLVWTGPSTSVAGLRRTLAVLSTLVANARESLVLVSFATHDVADLTAGLADATARGVSVTLILETPDDPGGPLSLGVGHPFQPLRPHARFYRWPVEAREAFFARTARLHAKCVIADRSSVLITSANLTSAGINDNIELGVLIEGGPLPARLSRHLEILAEDGTLEAV